MPDMDGSALSEIGIRRMRADDVARIMRTFVRWRKNGYVH